MPVYAFPRLSAVLNVCNVQVPQQRIAPQSLNPRVEFNLI